jgi:hypothetical protein
MLWYSHGSYFNNALKGLATEDNYWIMLLIPSAFSWSLYYLTLNYTMQLLSANTLQLLKNIPSVILFCGSSRQSFAFYIFYYCLMNSTLFQGIMCSMNHHMFILRTCYLLNSWINHCIELWPHTVYHAESLVGIKTFSLLWCCFPLQPCRGS